MKYPGFGKISTQKPKLIHYWIEIYKKMSSAGADVCGLASLAVGGRPKQLALKTLILPWVRVLDFNLGFAEGPQMNWRTLENCGEIRCGFGSQNSLSLQGVILAMRMLPQRLLALRPSRTLRCFLRHELVAQHPGFTVPYAHH